MAKHHLSDIERAKHNSEKTDQKTAAVCIKVKEVRAEFVTPD